jgi:hypothetical protein
VTRMTALAAATAVAAGFPAAAAAHGGPGRPPATDWTVELDRVPPGIEATPVYGDRDLRLTTARNVDVLGTLGEPMLRFRGDGVFANLASPTVHGDRIVRTGTSGWRQVAGGRTYTWHEHRLHAAEPAGGGPVVVPLRVDGTRMSLRGTLVRHDPGRRWPWLVATLGLLAVGLRLRPLRAAAVVALVAAVALRLGQAWHQQATADLALTAINAAALLVLVLVARSRDALGVLGLAVGALAVAQAIVTVPVLTRAIALNGLGTPGARAALVIAFTAGVVAASAGFAVLVRSDAE